MDRSTTQCKFSAILARDVNGGFGYKNTIPWKLPGDLQNFKKITCDNSEGKINNLVMGRKTWETLKKPLPNRREIVVTRNKNLSTKLNERSKDTIFVSSLSEALIYCNIPRTYTFVIGGSSLLKEAFEHPNLEAIYLTSVFSARHINFDVFFDNELPKDFVTVEHKVLLPSEDALYPPIFTKSIRWFQDTSEYQFIETLKRVTIEGETRVDRTGTGTVSIFGDIQMCFDLQEGFPLLTSKFVPLRLVFEELMWMLRGQTNIKFLKEKKCMIWNANYDAEYAKNMREKFGYPEGELGKLYGAQWRNFNGYHDLKAISDEEAKDNRNGRHIANAENGGVDQILDVINQIKTNPTSRRLIVSAWNPSVLDKVCLPSCHSFFQFNVRNNKYLDCKLYVRSNDLFLGAPFNIASYSLLMTMIAGMTDLSPGKLFYTIGDAHIYNNHLEQVDQLLNRPLRSLPTLTLNKIHENIEDFEYTDIKLNGYNSHPNIQGEMAV